MWNYIGYVSAYPDFPLCKHDTCKLPLQCVNLDQQPQQL